jgi:acyl-coenzyme A synthetase/AMP-(fatty) acid ligase
VPAFMDEFGDILYRLYGSTEVSWASIADPKDLRAAPTTAGRAPVGTRVEILDARGRPVPPGVVGQICVGNELPLQGYGGKHAARQKVEDLLRTGDRGYLDADGRLFVAGRADGDNAGDNGRDGLVVAAEEGAFPHPLERLLLTLPQVEDAAVVNVPDRDSGQRLAAYVALRPGATLTAAAVRDFLRGHMPRFAVLRDVIFVDSLTRTATARVMRKLLGSGEVAAGIPD